MQDFFTSKNFAVVIMTLAIIFLLAMLCQACSKKSGDSNDSEDSEGYVSQNSLSYEYYYDESEAYTNSQYLRSDDRNSLVDHANFKYD